MDAPDIHLLAAGTALPGPALDNATLIKRFNLPSVWEQWIDAYVGTRSRHFAVDMDTGEVRYTLADLGETAGGRALAAAGVQAEDVDLIVMGTATPDMLMPATVNQIAERLGIDGVPSYQLQSGCSGAIQALSVAYHLLRSGPYQTALVIGGDTCAKHLDIGIDISTRPPDEQINGVLFGDGAGALVLSRNATPDSVILRDVYLELTGMNRPAGQILEWWGEAKRDSGQKAVSEDYKSIEESVPKMAAESLNHILDTLDWDETDIDYLLPPQLSGKMTERITENLSAPSAHEISVVRDIGNTGNALPFFQLQQALPRMTSGDRAIAIAIESSKWIKAGFALEKD